MDYIRVAHKYYVHFPIQWTEGMDLMVTDLDPADSLEKHGVVHLMEVLCSMVQMEFEVVMMTVVHILGMDLAVMMLKCQMDETMDRWVMVEFAVQMV